jgi:hypothetical protein
VPVIFPNGNIYGCFQKVNKNIPDRENHTNELLRGLHKLPIGNTRQAHVSVAAQSIYCAICCGERRAAAASTRLG